LAEYDSLDQVMGVAAHLRSAKLPGVVDIVPAARTVLVHHTGGDTSAIAAALQDVRATAPVGGEAVELSVDYDGKDLATVATLCGLTVSDVVALHAGATYTVAFCGFMPGFAYLIGLDPRLQLPRRSSPRPRVPAGSVAIASEFSAVYPSASPGGWHLLGHTDAVLWDEQRLCPALLEPGTNVRFLPA
jgi:KipI family sensor histidine kinase inhibitor